MPLRTVGGKICLQVGDRHRLLLLHIEIVVEHLDESPLGPVVILRVAGAYLAVPVIAEPNPVELPPVAGDVLGGCLLGVLPGLDGILLGG